MTPDPLPPDLTTTSTHDLRRAAWALADLLGVVLRTSPAEQALEQAMLDAIVEGWNDRTREGARAAIAALAGGAESEPAGRASIDAALDALGGMLADGWQEPLRPAVERATTGLYGAGRDAVLAPIHVEPVLSLVDQRARDVLAGDAMYWVGSAWDRVLGAEIAGVVQREIVDKGLGRREAAEELQRILGTTFPERSLSYWETVAAAAAVRASTYGVLGSFEQIGLATFVFSAVLDARTSAICEHLHGRTFSVATAAAQRDAFLAAPDPDAAKAIHPWPDPARVVALKTDAELQAAGVMVPPLHGRCRSTLLAGDFQPPPALQPATVDLGVTDEARAANTAAIERALGPGFDVNELGRMFMVPDGFRSTVYVSPYRNGFHIEGAMHAVDAPAGAEPAALMARDVRRERGEVAVAHTIFELKEHLQGAGIGAGVIREALTAYQEWGVDRVDLRTAWTGRYTWASFGWSWDASEGKRRRERFASYLAREHGVEEKAAKRIATAAKTPWDVAGTWYRGVHVGKAYLLQETSWAGTLRLHPGDAGYERMRERLGVPERKTPTKPRAKRTDASDVPRPGYVDVADDLEGSADNAPGQNYDAAGEPAPFTRPIR